jgi:predicted ATPase
LARGRTLQEIRADKKSFENRVLDVKIATEARLPKNELIIFDRAIPDSIAYFELAGLDPKKAIAESPSNHYKKVFLLDQLPYEKDHVRIERRNTAAILERALEKSYSMVGYEVTRIGVMPVRERLRIVLESLEEVPRDEKKRRPMCH